MPRGGHEIILRQCVTDVLHAQARGPQFERVHDDVIFRLAAAHDFHVSHARNLQKQRFNDVVGRLPNVHLTACRTGEADADNGIAQRKRDTRNVGRGRGRKIATDFGKLAEYIEFRLMHIRAPVKQDIDNGCATGGRGRTLTTPGMLFIASSMGRVMVAIISLAGMMPLLTRTTTRGKFVSGNTDDGSITRAQNSR